MSPSEVRPFLITKDDTGSFRLTVRDTHYNSQGYPIVTSNIEEATFKTAAAARAFARQKYNAQAGQYAMK